MPNISDKYKGDYKELDYGNPRLAREKSKRQKLIRRIILVITAIFLALMFYFLFFSPFFQIKEVNITGLEKIKRENLDKIIREYRNERKFFVFSRNNFWLFSSKALKNKIAERYWFESLTVKKRLPGSVEINLKEKESAINWLTGDLCYHLDLTGLAIEYCEDNKGLLTIKDLKNETFEIGKVAVPKTELDYLVNMDMHLKQLAGDKFKIAYYEKQDNMLNVKTNESLVIMLNENITVEDQIARLSVLFNQTDVKNNLSKLSYIDLRFGDKVYYK